MSTFLRNIFKRSQTDLSPAAWVPQLVEDKENAPQQPEALASAEIFAYCCVSSTPDEFRYLIKRKTSLRHTILWPDQKPATLWQQRMAGTAGVLSTSPEFAFRNNPKSMPVLWMFARDTLSRGYPKTGNDIPSAINAETASYWEKANVIAIPASNSDAFNATFLANQLRAAQQSHLDPTLAQTPEAYAEMLLAKAADASAWALRTLWTIPDASLRASVWHFASIDPTTGPIAAIFSEEFKGVPDNLHTNAILNNATEKAFRAFLTTPVATLYATMALQEFLSRTISEKPFRSTGSKGIPADFYQKLLLTPAGYPYALADAEVSTLAQQTIQRALRNFPTQKGRGTSHPSP